MKRKARCLPGNNRQGMNKRSSPRSDGLSVDCWGKIPMLQTMFAVWPEEAHPRTKPTRVSRIPIVLIAKLQLVGVWCREERIMDARVISRASLSTYRA